MSFGSDGGKCLGQGIEQVEVVPIGPWARERCCVEPIGEAMDNATGVEAVECCIPFGKRIGQSRVQVEVAAASGAVAGALAYQLCGFGDRQQHNVGEAETTLREHLADGGEFAVKPRDGRCAYGGQAPAVMQFQRIAVTYRGTGLTLRPQRIGPPTCIDFGQVAGLLDVCGFVRFPTGTCVFGDERCPGGAAPGGLPGGTRAFDGNNHR